MSSESHPLQNGLAPPCVVQPAMDWFGEVVQRAATAGERPPDPLGIGLPSRRRSNKETPGCSNPFPIPALF